MKNKTLQEYLESLIQERPDTYEVNFKITRKDDRLAIMLHPKDRDGETVDYIVRGNKLIPRFGEDGTEYEEPHAYCHQCDEPIQEENNVVYFAGFEYCSGNCVDSWIAKH